MIRDEREDGSLNELRVIGCGCVEDRWRGSPELRKMQQEASWWRSASVGGHPPQNLEKRRGGLEGVGSWIPPALEPTRAGVETEEPIWKLLQQFRQKTCSEFGWSRFCVEDRKRTF